MSRNDEKTLIGVLASHDSPERNCDLARVIEYAVRLGLLEHYRFVLTGGTFGRLFNGDKIICPFETTTGCGHKGKVKYKLNNKVQNKKNEFIRLKSTGEGGVILLSALITQRKISIIWPFFSPKTMHLLYPENLALLRLADQWRVKKLMNTKSVKDWIDGDSKKDRSSNCQPEKLILKLPKCSDIDVIARKRQINEAKKNNSKKGNIAIISHDEMKPRMLDFVLDYEYELLNNFDHIFTTGTTGKLIKGASINEGFINKVIPLHSGPKGGDIEIASAILDGQCETVIFFVDPLNPHPHTEDIRVVFSACMIKDESTTILSNEVHARAWMDQKFRSQ